MKKILIVEEEKDIQRVYNTLLRQEGYDVVTAETSAQAEEVVKSSKPDLILLDLMLPGGKNGFDFLEKLKLDPTIQNIPVIILTNLDTGEQTARNMGVTDYFVKSSTSIETVIAAIKKKVPQESPSM